MEVYRRIYGRKFSFTATRKRSRQRDFRTYIRRYTSPNENFEYGYPHSNALLIFSLKKDSKKKYFVAPTSSGCQLHKTACQLHIFTSQPMKSDVEIGVRNRQLFFFYLNQNIYGEYSKRTVSMRSRSTKNICLNF